MASKKQIKSFIDNYSTSLGSKYSVYCRNNKVCVNLEFKFGQDAMLMSTLTFDNFEQVAQTIGFDIHNYSMIKEYMQNHEKLHIEKSRDYYTGELKNVFSLGDNQFRYLSSYSLQEMQDTMEQIFDNRLPGMPSHFLEDVGNYVVCRSDSTDDTFILTCFTKNNNLIGSLPGLDINKVVTQICLASGKDIELSDAQLDTLTQTLNINEHRIFVQGDGNLVIHDSMYDDQIRFTFKDDNIQIDGLDNQIIK